MKWIHLNDCTKIDVFLVIRLYLCIKIATLQCINAAWFHWSKLFTKTEIILRPEIVKRYYFKMIFFVIKLQWPLRPMISQCLHFVFVMRHIYLICTNIWINMQYCNHLEMLDMIKIIHNIEVFTCFFFFFAWNAWFNYFSVEIHLHVIKLLFFVLNFIKNPLGMKVNANDKNSFNYSNKTGLQVFTLFNSNARSVSVCDILKKQRRLYVLFGNVLVWQWQDNSWCHLKSYSISNMNKANWLPHYIATTWKPPQTSLSKKNRMYIVMIVLLADCRNQLICCGNWKIKIELKSR